MKFQYSDGGRSRYFNGITGDCVTRSFANGLGKDYLEVYSLINELCCREKNKIERIRGKNNSNSFIIENGNAMDGLFPATIKKLGRYFNLNFVKKKGKTNRLRGNYIVLQYGHLTCVRGGFLLDTHDCSGDDYYGYFKL